MKRSKSLPAMFRALKNRNYRIFFVGQSLSLIGTWIQQTGEIWLAYRLTHSAFALGVVGFASQIPTFLLAAFAGAWVDRTDKHRLVIVAQVLEMCQAFALAFLVLTHLITYHWLIVLSLIGGTFDALEIPSRQSFVVDLVENPADLGNAIALNSSLVNAARLLGPAMAGILISVVGEGGCFLINGASYLAIIVSLFLMRLPLIKRLPTQKGFWQTLSEGVNYARGSVPIAILLLSLALVSMIASSYTVLIPIFAAQVLHGGPHTLGFLMAASGLGAMMGALQLAARKTVLGLGRVIGAGIGGFGIALVVFSLSHWFWLSWIAMVSAGFGMMMGTASINTMLQTIVEPDKRGRVMSFFTTAFMGMAPIGNLIGGTLASRIGAPESVGLAGALCLLAALWYSRHLENLRHHIRPIYRQLGILPPDAPVLPEIAAGLQVVGATVKPRG